ncbi:MAG: hypothetical protein KKF41_13050 [Actinobacteria bacterium]|nr:hypothetical protein [Actinomycetota bacterium]MBU1944008.1 hypothetical protein [Actinomycetota bacterium]MBU2688504.1 hypothetical protein [Actinomycetota bacterium]
MNLKYPPGTKTAPSIRFVLVSLLLAILLSVGAAVAVPPRDARAANSDWEQVAKDGLGNGTEMIAPSVIFGGELFFITGSPGGSGDPVPPAPVLAYDGYSFRTAAAAGFGDQENATIFPTIVFNGELYAGTQKRTTAGQPGQLWKSPDGNNWTRLGQATFTDADDFGVQPMGVQDGMLLVGSYNEVDGCRVWAYDGSVFTRANTDGFGLDMKELSAGNGTFQGKVYTVAYDTNGPVPFRPLVWSGGKTWAATAPPGFGDPGNALCFMLASDGRQLCAGVGNLAGCQVWSFDGSAWSQVGEDGFGDPTNNIGALALPWYGDVYVSTFSLGAEGPQGPARVYFPNPDGTYQGFASNGFGDTTNQMIILSGYFKGSFYAGTLNYTKGFQLWRTPVPPFHTYYFAEGTTRNNPIDGAFQEWLCVQNPGDAEVTADVTYLMGDGTSLERSYPVPALSRLTVDVNTDVGPDRDVSVVVEGSGPIVVERPMYFNYHNQWTGGHDITGVPFPEKTWYFAEGTTRNNPIDGAFEEWVCVMNPNADEARVTFDYMLGDGSNLQRVVSVPGNSRHTESVNADVGPQMDVSVAVSSDLPVVCERPMYFNYHNQWTGGHDTSGVSAPGASAYFAEGCTYAWNDEWLCIQNPGDIQADIEIRYQVAGQGEVTQAVTVPPASRYTVDVNAAVGADRDVSASFTSSVPVVAERPMYFDYQYKWRGGHDVMGLPEAKTRFYFAEGTTRQNASDGYFDEWLCLQNPGDTEASVEMVFMLTDGTTRTEAVTIPARGRHTASANAILGADVDSSVFVSSDVPVVAERPMYFLYHGSLPGGSDTMGVTYP